MILCELDPPSELMFSLSNVNISNRSIAGFYPDNGGSHFLSRLPGALGVYLGLTCTQVKGEDTYNIGLATHFTTSRDGSVGTPTPQQ